MGLRTYAMEKPAAEGDLGQIRRRRYLNVDLDSHSRLFGDPDDGNMFRAKPDRMRSDILGTGTGTGKEMRPYEMQKRTSDVGGGSGSEHDEQEYEHDSNGNASMEIEGGGSEQGQGGDDNGDEQSQQGDGDEADGGRNVSGAENEINIMIEITSSDNETTPVAKNGGTARDESGNPVTGSGYREDTPHRRRQYGNRQNARSGFW